MSCIVNSFKSCGFTCSIEEQKANSDCAKIGFYVFGILALIFVGQCTALNITIETITARQLEFGLCLVAVSMISLIFQCIFNCSIEKSDPIANHS